MSKIFLNVKTFVTNKAVVTPILLLIIFLLILTTSAAFAATTAGAVEAKELDSVWDKVSSGISGTYGKLGAIGIIGASVWNREKIGMLGMGVGIIIGALVPSIPSIINGFTYTI